MSLIALPGEEYECNMNETESDRDEVFWEELATSCRKIPSLVPMLRPAADDADIDDLILRYIAGELDPEEEIRLRRLAGELPDLAGRMAEALHVLRDVDTEQVGSPDRVWAQVTAFRPAYSAPARLVDLAVQLLAEGLELLRSAGRPAYPALVTRSTVSAPTLTIAQEFLTSAGILDVIIDFRDAGCWQLLARPRLLPSSVQPREFTLCLRDAGGGVRGECPLTESGLVIDSLPPGEYELIVVEGDQEASSLLISCVAAEKND